MQVFSKELLMANGEKMCTLTVATTPSNATCRLYYNGAWHIEKSCTVPKGTEVQYEIYYTGYISQSGSWVITEDTSKSVVLDQANCSVSLRAISSYSGNTGKLNCSLTVDGETKTETGTKNATLTINKYKASVNYYWSVSNSTFGTKTGSGTVSNYGSKTIFVRLTGTGTWAIS